MKRATAQKLDAAEVINISIHALVKRATPAEKVEEKSVKISIHALVKRATYHGLSPGAVWLYFNPRPREEGDKLAQVINLAVDYFNPRPREEGDAGLTNDKRKFWYFNPRPREEGDFSTLIQYADIDISIHALVKRATYA